MQLITISDEAKKCLENLEPAYQKVSEMFLGEKEFLTEIILQNKPKKILEVGVAAGSSSVIMLNALMCVSKDFEFHSVDYNKQYYRNKEKLTGYIIEEYPNLVKQRKFYAGGFALNFMDEIGAGIDFCFIDTVHSVPGEVLDFLMVLPYLQKNAIVVFHDTNLHTFEKYRTMYVNNLLVSAISGNKILPDAYSDVFSNKNNDQICNYDFPNIVAIRLDEFQKERVWDIFNLLTQHWQYSPAKDELLKFIDFTNRHYGQNYANFLKKIVNHQVYHLDKSKKEVSEKEKQAEVAVEKARQAELNSLVIFYIKIKLFRYSILSKILLGNARQRYKNKRKKIKNILKVS